MFDREGFYREVGLRLHMQRKRRDLTQEDVATAIGIPRATYANVERGRQRVALDVIWKVGVYLGVPLDRLVPEAITETPRGETPPESASSQSYVIPANLRVHVVPSAVRAGTFVVKAEGDPRPLTRPTTQQGSVAKATKIARKNQVEVVVHGRDGRVRDMTTRGNDPAPPKDRKH